MFLEIGMNVRGVIRIKSNYVIGQMVIEIEIYSYVRGVIRIKSNKIFQVVFGAPHRRCGYTFHAILFTTKWRYGELIFDDGSDDPSLSGSCPGASQLRKVENRLLGRYSASGGCEAS